MVPEIRYIDSNCLNEFFLIEKYIKDWCQPVSWQHPNPSCCLTKNFPSTNHSGIKGNYHIFHNKFLITNWLSLYCQRRVIQLQHVLILKLFVSSPLLLSNFLMELSPRGIYVTDVACSGLENSSFCEIYTQSGILGKKWCRKFHEWGMGDGSSFIRFYVYYLEYPLFIRRVMYSINERKYWAVVYPFIIIKANICSSQASGVSGSDGNIQLICHCVISLFIRGGFLGYLQWCLVIICICSFFCHAILQFGSSCSQAFEPIKD